MEKTILNYDVGATFGHANIIGASVPGFEPSDDPLIPVVDPTYLFRIDLLRVMIAWWTSILTGRTTDGLFLSGPTGTGKTSLPEQVFARLNVPYYSITTSKYSEIEPMIQTKTIANGTVFPQDGVLTLAMRQGCPLVINEMDRMNGATMSGLHDILERQFVTIPDSGEVVRASRGFGIIATNNTRGQGDETGMYRGAEQQDISLLDRFWGMHVPYMDDVTETNLLESRHTLIGRPILEKLVGVANEIRKGFEATDGSGLAATMSTRTLNRWALCIAVFESVRNTGVSPAMYALEIALLNKCDGGTRQAIAEIAKAKIPELVN